MDVDQTLQVYLGKTLKESLPWIDRVCQLCFHYRYKKNESHWCEDCEGKTEAEAAITWREAIRMQDEGGAEDITKAFQWVLLEDGYDPEWVKDNATRVKLLEIARGSG